MQEKHILDDCLRQRLNLIRAAGKLGVTGACERFGKHPHYWQAIKILLN